MTMEIDYMNVEERYNMRKYYNLPYTEEEITRAMDIRYKWYAYPMYNAYYLLFVLDRIPKLFSTFQSF